MKCSLMLSFLFAGLALAAPTLVNDKRIPFHQQIFGGDPQTTSTRIILQDGSSTLSNKKIPHVDYHGGFGSRDLYKAPRPQAQIVRRSAMKQTEHGSKSSSRSSSLGRQLASPRNLSPLRLLSSSSGSSSHASPSLSGSRSSSSSSLARSSSETSWDRSPRDYDEAFRRLGISPPRSPSSQQRVQSQHQRGVNQRAQVNGQHRPAQQGAPVVGDHINLSREASQSSQRSLESGSSSEKAEQSQ